MIPFEFSYSQEIKKNEWIKSKLYSCDSIQMNSHNSKKIDNISNELNEIKTRERQLEEENNSHYYSTQCILYTINCIN